ncbi:two-component regulator propeller domain-containing protein [Pseudoalteromonas luteoviolacea]|uniref:two-component regulator propeller domain-containing protein n=1 Tax=Pseudoalteromonas luteoviolacea TaxID=43657 RepID=UPI000ABDDE94|nr:two-component regulator propeller domain-containing protein [Pseudoalteromonas luteoviolacea]
MYQLAVFLLCLMVSCFVAAQSTSVDDAVFEVKVHKVQTAVWQNVSTLSLPSGKPSLELATQIDLDRPKSVGWIDANRYEFKDNTISYELIPNATFDQVTPARPFNHWSKVKSAQYELNTLSDIRHFSPRQGLPTGSVYKVAQDAQGVLWLATNGEGVCQYIADYFRCFTDVHGLSNNRVWDIKMTDSGLFLLATDRGINTFDGKFFYTLKAEEAGFKEKINRIAVLGDTFYFSSNAALYKFRNNTLVKVNGLKPIGKINDLVVDNGKLWIASTTGLYRLTEDRLSTVVFENRCDGAVTSITNTTNRITVAVANDGICALDKASQDVHYLSGIGSLNVTALFFDEIQNTLWIGDDSKGVVKVKNESAYVYNKQNGLSDQHIRGLMQDAQGHIWVSTYGAGINRIKENGFRLLTKRSGLRRERVSALANIDSKLWVGQYGTGIQVLDKGQWLEPSLKLDNQYIHSIAQDHEGRVWVGSRQGAMVLGNERILHLWHDLGLQADIVHQIIRAPNQCMYMATAKGLYRSCNNTLQFLDLAKEEYVIDVFSDKSERIWFVTNGGGTYYLENDYVYRFTEATGLASDWAYSIAQSDDNTMYIGSRRGVLVLQSQGRTWRGRHIGMTEGLSSHIVLGLKVHNDYLWIGTERGNNRLKTEHIFDNALPLRIDSFAYDNGYLAVDATLNTAVYLDNTFYWGSGSGVTYFDPSSLDLNASLQSRILEVFSLSDSGPHQHAPGKSSVEQFVEFSPNTLQIFFKFSHNDWATPERVLYQTRLLGSSEAWSEPASLSEITYNHLTPGQYEFQVRAITSSETGEPTSYSFILLAPWWQTWWAYSLLLFTTILLIYVVIQWRFSFLAKQQRIKDRAEFSEALLERKKQLLAEVSHEIRTPLSVLKMSIEGLEYNLLEDSEKTYQLLHRRIGDINLLVADIDQLASTELDERALNLEDVLVKSWLESWCNDAKGRVSQQHGYHFETDLDLPSSTTISADRDRLTQVLTNLLSNSLRYTASPAKIKFAAKLSQQQLLISLSDSAPGVLENELESIFERMYQSEKNKSLYKGGTGLGLAICQDLVVRHGGSIVAQHSEFGGLSVIIRLDTLQ